MKQLAIIFISVLMLSGCGSASNKALKLVEGSIKVDEGALVALNSVKETEEEFLTLMSDILIEGEQNFDKANTIIPQAAKLLKEVDVILQEQEVKLKLSDEKVKKIEKLIKELGEEELSMMESFLDYKNHLTLYLELKLELNDAYETFLSQIKSDTTFKDIELMIASLNKKLDEVSNAYTVYENSVYDFSAKYEQVLNK